MEKKEQARETVIGIMPYDSEKVLSNLKQKKYDDIFLRDRGRLDDFVGFLYQTGILELFDGIDSRMERRPEIPRQFLHYCISLKPVVDSASINQLSGRLLEDTDSLRTLGFTMVAMEKGGSVKNKKGNNVPVNINAFYDELARLPETESKKFFTSGVELLDKKRFLSKKSGVYALDGVKLLITGDKKYENYGKISIEDENGKRAKEKGYKLVFLQRVNGDDHYIVAAKLIPLNQQEITVAEELVEEALCVLGENSIKTLLIDRGFLSGSFFNYLGGRGIDFICPTKDTLHITRHMQGLHRAGEGVKTTLADDTVLAGYNRLISMDGCKRKINGVLIIKQGNKARKKVIEGNEFGFLTSLPTGQNQQIETVYNLAGTGRLRLTATEN
ncbi:MAG: transposase [Candidatus Omnitrophica bacterium]|nr:transposase [Candidatus Omnitrophota bacterium]